MNTISTEIKHIAIVCGTAPTYDLLRRELSAKFNQPVTKFHRYRSMRGIRNCLVFLGYQWTESEALKEWDYRASAFLHYLTTHGNKVFEVALTPKGVTINAIR